MNRPSYRAAIRERAGAVLPADPVNDAAQALQVPAIGVASMTFAVVDGKIIDVTAARVLGHDEARRVWSTYRRLNPIVVSQPGPVAVADNTTREPVQDTTQSMDTSQIETPQAQGDDFDMPDFMRDVTGELGERDLEAQGRVARGGEGWDS